jgi:hypothetical protein
MPIILVVIWIHAAHLMHAGFWCWHLAGNRWAATITGPRDVLTRVAGRREMHHLIRRGFECSGLRPGRWLCAPH